MQFYCQCHARPHHCQAIAFSMHCLICREGNGSKSVCLPLSQSATANQSMCTVSGYIPVLNSITSLEGSWQSAQALSLLVKTGLIQFQRWRRTIEMAVIRHGRGDSDNRHIALRFKRDQLAFFALMLFTQIRNPHSPVIMPNTDDNNTERLL